MRKTFLERKLLQFDEICESFPTQKFCGLWYTLQATPTLLNDQNLQNYSFATINIIGKIQQ